MSERNTQAFATSPSDFATSPEMHRIKDQFEIIGYGFGRRYLQARTYICQIRYNAVDGLGRMSSQDSDPLEDLSALDAS